MSDVTETNIRIRRIKMEVNTCAILKKGIILLIFKIILLSTSFAQAQAQTFYDYKGCRIVITGPTHNLAEPGGIPGVSDPRPAQLVANVRSFDITTGRVGENNCGILWIRLRQNKKWRSDRNLGTAKFNHEGQTKNSITITYNCRGNSSMRVFAEIKIQGKKLKSKPKKGIKVNYCG